jgi:membrane-bound lytic murein transglycosylase MltF
VTRVKALSTLTLVAILVSLGGGAGRAQAQQASGTARGITTRLEGPVKDDADALIERRVIRVAVPYSRSLYFNDKGRERGLSADFVRDFERYVNTKYKKQLRNRPITVVIRPTTRDILLKNVVDGLADIAVGNLTITEERLRLVDFVPPDGATTVSEVVLTGPKGPRLASANDLSGRTVHARRASSYHESLAALNDRLAKDQKPPVKVVLVPDALEDEDMMEMLNAGLFQAIVVDDWKARMWGQVLPRITVNDGAVLRSGGKIGWAIRKDSPKLSALLEDFYTDFVKKQGVLAVRMKQYYARVKQLKNPTAAEERRRFEKTLALFRKYGTQYRFDPLMLAAQGYQESQLNQSARSHVGAIGIMQVMPATGKELKVGDIRVAESNVHAGAKYMDQLMTRYLRDAKFDDTNRTLFAFACYNAGPGNIARMRKEAKSRDLDPDQWFNNVELVTAEKIGAETTTYVRNIFKYYVAYTLMVDVQSAQDKARSTVDPAK